MVVFVQVADRTVAENHLTFAEAMHTKMPQTAARAPLAATPRLAEITAPTATAASPADTHPRRRRCPLRRVIPRAWQEAFTLIELLVVIAIIALLVGILLPTIGSVRTAARKTRELSAAQQLMTAYHNYANAHKGELPPGYAPSGMVTGIGDRQLQVFDERGERVFGLPARRYPWRVLPFMDYSFSGLYDQTVLAAYRQREDFRYVVSVSPALGINADYVGGRADPGIGFLPAALRTFGSFYLTRVEDARRPDRLITFASARGVDATGGMESTGVVPGFHQVLAPQPALPNATNVWPTTRFDRAQAPEQFGHVDPRFADQAVAAHIDGHASGFSIDQLRDMTRWSNQAQRAEWRFGDGLN